MREGIYQMRARVQVGKEMESLVFSGQAVKGHAIVQSGRFSINLMPEGSSAIPIDIGLIRYARRKNGYSAVDWVALNRP